VKFVFEIVRLISIAKTFSAVATEASVTR